MMRLPNQVRIFDDVLPIDILTKLSKKGFEIKTIRTNDVNVEEYYLSLIGGARHV